MKPDATVGETSQKQVCVAEVDVLNARTRPMSNPLEIRQNISGDSAPRVHNVVREFVKTSLQHPIVEPIGDSPLLSNS